MVRNKKKGYDQGKIDQILRQRRYKPTTKEDIAAKVYAWLAVNRVEILHGEKDLSERQRIEYEYDIPSVGDKIDLGVIPALDEDPILTDIALLKHFGSIDIDAQVKSAWEQAERLQDVSVLFDSRQGQFVSTLPQWITWLGEVIDDAKQNLESEGLRWSETDGKIREPITSTRSTDYATRKIAELWDFLQPRFELRDGDDHGVEVHKRLVEDIITLLAPYFDLTYDQARGAIHRIRRAEKA